MRTKRRLPLLKIRAFKGMAEKPSLPGPSPRKRQVEGWLRGRRAAMQPWRRGRIRPSTCRDLPKEP